MVDCKFAALEHWMIDELKRGPQDFGFCQRVVDFARKHIDTSLSDKAGVELYLNLCKQLNLVTKHIDGHFVTFYAAPEKPKSIFWDGE